MKVTVNKFIVTSNEGDSFYEKTEKMFIDRQAYSRWMV